MIDKKQKTEELVQTRFGSFLCIFESNYPEPGFTVTSPAAHGFVTHGPTISVARKLAKEGLEFHYECTILEQCAPQNRAMQYA
ncbi:MAG: hypothetical protein Q8R17_00485 [bacterium]|nr:hypothetical protein [bacterium]